MNFLLRVALISCLLSLICASSPLSGDNNAKSKFIIAAPVIVIEPESVFAVTEPEEDLLPQNEIPQASMVPFPTNLQTRRSEIRVPHRDRPIALCDDCFESIVTAGSSHDYCDLCMYQRHMITSSAEFISHQNLIKNLSATQWDRLCAFLNGLYDLEFGSMTDCVDEVAFLIRWDMIFKRVLRDNSASELNRILDHNFFDINRKLSYSDHCPLSYLFDKYRCECDLNPPVSEASLRKTQEKIDVLINRPGIVLNRVIDKKHLIFHSIDVNQFRSFLLILEVLRDSDLSKVFRYVCRLPGREQFFDHLMSIENVPIFRVHYSFNPFFKCYSSLSLCLQSQNLGYAQKLLDSPKLSYYDLLITDSKTAMTVYRNFTGSDSSYRQNGLVLPEIPYLHLRVFLYYLLTVPLGYVASVILAIYYVIFVIPEIILIEQDRTRTPFFVCGIDELQNLN